MHQRYTWNKAEKLKSRKRIDQVFKQGKSFTVFPFKVFYLVTGPAAPRSDKDAPIQAGFGAGSRHFKKAVDRNRIKRLCREAYRLQKPPLVDHLGARGLSLAVFFVYVGKELPDYQTVTEKIAVILRKLVKETA
jgi:ribonuclease P protein component